MRSAFYERTDMCRGNVLVCCLSVQSYQAENLQSFSFLIVFRVCIVINADPKLVVF